MLVTFMIPMLLLLLCLVVIIITDFFTIIKLRSSAGRYEAHTITILLYADTGTTVNNHHMVTGQNQ